MRVGKNYLIHLGDWHTFVGQVDEQTGPLQYRLICASKVDLSNAGGDVWEKYCAGDEEVRRLARHWHYTGEVVVPLSIAAIEYHGQLMHPDAPNQPKPKLARPAP